MDNTLLKQTFHLKDWTTWRIGGDSLDLYRPTTIGELATIVQNTTQLGRTLAIIGYGSNVLVDDSGFDGAIVVLKKNFSQMIFETNNILKLEAGFACPKLARLTWNLGFKNLAFLAGIPGSIGGAVKMNAGAHQQAIMEHVLQLELMDDHGLLHLYSRDQLHAVYRKTILPFSGIITRIWLKLSKNGPLNLNEVLEYRSKTQPLAEWSCGSVFKNPDAQVSAGWLIEQVGLKGYRVGDLEISSKHANFMLNKGRASAQNVLDLTRLIQQRVYLLTGFILTPEYQRLSSCFYD